MTLFSKKRKKERFGDFIVKWNLNHCPLINSANNFIACPEIADGCPGERRTEDGSLLLFI